MIECPACRAKFHYALVMSSEIKARILQEIDDAEASFSYVSALVRNEIVTMPVVDVPGRFGTVDPPE